MADLINDSDAFPRLFAGAKISAFKLEVRTAYGVAEEDHPFQQFLSGNDPGIEWLQPWLALMQETRGRGVSVRRIRIVDEPPSDYLRFEISVTPANLQVGEDIRYLSRTRAMELGLPAIDFWLIDSSHLYVLHFDDDDRYLGLGEVSDSSAIANYTTLCDRAWKRTTRFRNGT